MKKIVLTLGLLAVAVPTASLEAQRGRRWHNREVRQELRECRRELRQSESRAEFYRELRECNRELARARQTGQWLIWDRRWRHW